MDIKIMMGLIAGAGAFAYNIYYFLKAVEKARSTPEKEKFDLLKSFMTVAPSVVLGFLAGYALNPEGYEFMLVLTAGWTAADHGSEFGINSYFS